MAFDASPSWSGFNYQGKVALYYAIKQINTDLLGADLTNYSLMLEDTEDFEIRCDGAPLSFHQVKAYNSSSYSEYSDALLGIVLELYKQPGVIGRIHTWRLINHKPGAKNLIESIKDDLKNILDEYCNSNPKEGGTILEKAASTESNIKKQAAILRAAFKGNTSAQFYELLNDILEETSDTLTRFDSYRYDEGNSFCGLSEINDKIKIEVIKYLREKDIAITPERVDKTFFYFLGVMDRYIIQRHKTKKSDERITLEFNDIVRAIENDHEDIGKEYLAFKFKEKFASLIDEYIEDPDDYIEPKGDLTCNLKEARRLLLSLSPQELWEYYRSFSPQIPLDHECNTVNALETNFEGVRHILITAFHKINIERVVQDGSLCNFIYRTNAAPYKNYLPTTITNVARKSYIAKKIVNNTSMSEALYEVGNLIYGGTEPYDFPPHSMTHTAAPQAESEDVRSKRDEILKNIKLVPLSTAEGILNS